VSDHVEPFVVVAVTQNETRVWNAGLDSNSKPEKIHAPEHEARHHHQRQASNHLSHAHGSHDDVYYDSIADAVSGAKEVLIVGHGKGKASHMLRLVQYLERKHPSIAQKVVGSIDSDLPSMTENQILALSRQWFDHHHDLGW
jgi:hypothetical protein